jgi:hypothetical protein
MPSKCPTLITEHTLIATSQLISVDIQLTVHNCIYICLPEDEPSGSKHAEDIKKLKIIVLI